MKESLRSLVCTTCGREISVPIELETFSCVYCGAKLSLRDYYSVSGQTADPADLDYARAHLFDCIRDYPRYWRNFSRQHYDETYNTYLAGISETYLVLDRYLCAAPERRDAVLDEMVRLFLREWEDYHNNSGKRRSKHAVEKRMFENKLTLAFYTVPAIRGLDLSISEDYTHRLQEAFVQAYPKNIFEVATYEDISGGFRKRKLCFITTAVCELDGKPDDCAELTAFRAFRDGWLSETEAGRALVDEYYEIAPSIVQIMTRCDDANAVGRKLRETYLDLCYSDLQAGRYASCRDRYISMVNDLKSRYFMN